MTCSQYEQHDDRWILNHCLRQYGLNDLADNVITTTKIGFFDNCLDILIQEAKKRKDNEVLEMLYFSGLIYGTEAV
jgi:hypothetical protein